MEGQSQEAEDIFLSKVSVPLLIFGRIKSSEYICVATGRASKQHGVF